MARTTDPILLSEWVSSLDDGAIAVIAHRNGDMDTIGSSTVISDWIGPRAKATGLHADKISKRMLKRTGMEFRIMDSRRPTLPRKLSGIIAVDAGSPSQLGLDLPRDVPLFVIDHHANSSDPWPDEASIYYQEASSTCEMIVEMLERESANMVERWAEMLYAGILTDTGRFRHGSASGLRAAYSLLSSVDFDTDDVLATIEGNNMPPDQRKRVLKSVSSMDLHHCGDLLVASARSGSHESRVASSMIGSGADVSIVFKKLDSGGTRITTRASKNAVEEGVDMGEILTTMAESKGGDGGGHSGAAGWTGDVPTDEALAFILATVGMRSRGG
tara:strand:+ start:5387 stop:6376 length:990 start_codon:yes stop_codon:yes gene_type:complete